MNVFAPKSAWQKALGAPPENPANDGNQPDGISGGDGNELAAPSLSRGESQPIAGAVADVTAAPALTYSTPRAVDFLSQRPGFPVLSFAEILAGGKKGKFETRSFPKRERAELESWIEPRQGKGNLYYSVNTAIKPQNKKLERTDLKELVSLHIDLDPLPGETQEAAQARILSRLEKLKRPPSWVIVSGGGVQVIFDLVEGVPINGDLAIAEDLKLYNVQLERELGGDACHNVDRIMRIPGTVNVPDEGKIAKGRKPAVAYILAHNKTNYTLADFKKADAAPTSTNVGVESGVTNVAPVVASARISDVHAHPTISKAPGWALQLIVTGTADGKTWESDSHKTFAVACEFDRLGVSREDAAAIFTDKEWPISAHVLRQKNRTYTINRLLDRAALFNKEPDIDGMNEKHAVIGDLRGKCRVLNEIMDPLTGHRGVSFSHFKDIQSRYANRKHKWKNADGEEKSTPLAAWWFHHDHRRYFETVAFAPGGCPHDTYNLWHGFTVEPIKGDCSFYLAHVRDNICRGDDELYKYVIKWLAHAVQFPGEIGRVALVLRGRMGIGKGEFAQHFGWLFGPCFIPVTKPDHITGKFNGHMGQCVVLFADEAFYAGNHTHEAILKTLVSEKTWMIEYKGFDAKRSPSCLHNILSSNSDWVVPTEADDRRYCIIDCGDAHIQDSAYFIAIKEQMKAGGYEALLYHLLKEIDLKGYNAEKFPRTKEHARQRALSLRGVDALIYTLCNEGTLPCAHPNYPEVTISTGEEHGRGFYHYAKKKVPELDRKSSQALGNVLKDDWDCLAWRSNTERGIQFPPLAELRDAFIKKHGAQVWTHNVAAWSEFNVKGGTQDAIPM
jgi:hypothetical protein